MGKHLLPRSEEHRKKLSDAQKRAQENQELLARRRAWFLSIRNTNGPGLNYTHSNKFKQRASALWKDGLSVSEIANRLKVKKNVISGLAHRNRALFPHRRSPIAFTQSSGDVIAVDGSHKLGGRKKPAAFCNPIQK